MIVEVLPTRLRKCLLMGNVLTEGVRDHQRELGFGFGINRGHANSLGHARGMSHNQTPFLPHVHGAETSLTLRGSWITPSLIAQLVNHLPAVQETWVRFLGWEDSPGERHGNPLQYSCLENPMDRGSWQATVHGIVRVGHDLATKPPATF